MYDVADFKTTFQEFMERWPDAQRHRLVAGSADWEKITPILVSLGNAQDFALGTDNYPLMMVLAKMDRCIYEAVYCMGYERGKNEKPMPVFVVAEEKGENDESIG